MSRRNVRMKLTKNQLQFVINCDVETIVSYLQHDLKLSVLEVFDKIYSSNIYQKSVNSKTGLYLQSPDYIYDYLRNEIKK